MKSPIPTPLVLAVAAVLAGGLAAPADAQYRVQQNGTALDANNRLGSGGSNGAAGQNINDRYRVNGNSVVTGNVTGGAGFRGPVGYSAPGQFNDFTAGRSFDNFGADSAGTTAGGRVSNNTGTVSPFYGVSSTITAPAGYVRNTYAGGYEPPNYAANGGTVYSGGNGAFTGYANTVNARVANNLSLPAGRFGGEGGNYGATQDGAPDGGYSPAPSALTSPEDYSAYTSSNRSISPYTSLARDNRFGAIDQDTVVRLRGELLRDGDNQRLAPEQLQTLLQRRTDAAGRDQRDQSVAAGERVGGETPDARVNARIGPDGKPLPDTGEGLRLAGAGDQSQQYAQLLDRLDRFEKDPYADALRPLQRRQPAQGEQPDALPGIDVRPQPTPNEPANPNDADAPAADPPVAVRSLASGVSSPTLRGVYEQAEQEMAEGQFTNAIARYDSAERLVPNQPLTQLGKATAELGAGYYRRSVVSLRRSLGENRELAMAQLDLAKLLGTDRVKDVAESLRQRAIANREDPEPTFLLAFIAYNTGNLEQAAAFLDLSERRSGGDPFYANLKKMWGLGEPQKPEDATPATPDAAPAPAAPAPAAASDLPGDVGGVLPRSSEVPAAAPATRPVEDYNK